MKTDAELTSADGCSHLVFQFTGSEQEVWLNGKCAGTRLATPFTGTSEEFYPDKPPKWSNVPSHYFQGAMRGVRICRRGLDPVGIGALVKASL